MDNTASIHKRTIFEPWNFGEPTHRCSHCNALMWYEERINKRDTKYMNPKFSLCCMNGNISLPALQEPSEFLKNLLEFGDDPRSAEFMDLIRVYNSIFAFTSTGGKIDNSVNNGSSPYCFRINGLNHYKIGSLLPIEGQRPKFSQLYIFDTLNEVNNRMCIMDDNSRLDPNIVQGLIEMLDNYNPLCQIFRQARDLFSNDDRVHVKIKLIGTRSKDARQYNLPTSAEVAVLIVEGDEDYATNRDIVIQEHGGTLQRISKLHPSYMALQYPLIFPRAEDGYTTDILHRGAEWSSMKRTKTTQFQYFAYRLQYRENEGNTVLNCGRLTQQICCDAYTSIRAERANWVMRNQPKLRSDIVRGLEDVVVRGDTNPTAVGKRIILPSSFTGSPRYMIQAYQDSMTICRWAGAPDLFLTFTTNPKWPEIKEGLKKSKGKKSENRPELISRVFKIKLDQLIWDLTKENFFGRTIGVVYTVEFQKRGLPHAHTAVFLHPEDKPKNVTDVDRIITAELPDEQTDSVGFKAVTQYMLHGPCGAAFQNNSCMVDNKCDKHFPKPFQDHTTLSHDGFPVYMRRNNGKTAKVKGVELNNN